MYVYIYIYTYIYIYIYIVPSEGGRGLVRQDPPRREDARVSEEEPPDARVCIC